MASAHEPLISYPSKNTTVLSCKAFSLALTVASLICLATIITLQLPIVHHSNPLHPSDLCTQSPNPVACHAIVAGAIDTVQSQISDPHPVQILQTLINQSLGQLDTTVVAATTIRHRFNDLPHQSALTDCIYLLELSHDRLLDSATAAAGGAHTDARTWLSAVLTNYGTCLDELTGPSTLPIKANLNSLSALASASLSVLNAVSTYNGDVTETVTKFPSWVTTRDRKLLEASLTDVIPANVVVATDGSGDYDSVQDAVNSAPDKGTTRYVIHVRNGTYKENVVVGKKKTNVMIVGDGMNSTVITGSLNVVDGSTTFNSATLAAVGDGFILQDICIENTAGPAKHQAVALRMGADRSVINRCQLNAYQDTLYAHSLRQFYRDSLISGTVDFIFGNAAVVFQNCSLIARLPMSNQQNLVTAQGRMDPNQNTGTSIQNCQVIPSPDLKPMVATIPTYLGRPWKNFSRTVYMQSYIDSHINPKGWLEWDGAFYRDSLISGTVDFIFGNAAVVFQNCSLIARLPMSNQQNLVTAQGRMDPNQNTGTSIQNCQVIPSPDLKPMVATIPTYLGRPWKNFSRTVYMQSYIDSHINPKGWLEWDGAFALDTLYYGEFANTGPGAGIAGRVNWTGYHVITDPSVANNFTVAELIQGGTWLQSTGVTYTEGL